MNIFLPLSSGTSVESVSSSFPAVDSASSPLMASKKLMQLSIVITQNVTKILLIYYIARDDMQQTGVCTKAGGWKDLKTFIVNLWGEISS